MPDGDEPSASDALQQFFDAYLTPLLTVDGGAASILSVDDEVVRLRVQGSAAYGVGAHYVRTRIIEPAVQHVLPGRRVEFELVAVKPPRSTRPESP